MTLHQQPLQLNSQLQSVLSSEAAEFVKLAETTYRDVNIGLANQFAMHAQQFNLDIQNIINAKKGDRSLTMEINKLKAIIENGKVFKELKSKGLLE